jgi:Tol biopolymer transport system component
MVRVLLAFGLAMLVVAVAGAGAKGPPRNGLIAFWSDLGPAVVFVMKPDGTGRRRLTTSNVRSKGAAWSPDGKRAALYGATAADSDNFDIFVVDSDGSDRRRLTSGSAREVQPAWSPDGRRIAYVRDEDIWIMDSDGGNQHLAIRNGGEPSWSPNGRRLVYGSLRRSRVQVYTANLDGSRERKLTRGRADSEMPSWSPDGRRIVFTTFRNGETDVYVMRADGSHERRLTRSPARDEAASWSPDGRKIVFSSYRKGNGEIYVMNANGTHQRRLTRTRINEEADGWQPLPR